MTTRHQQDKAAKWGLPVPPGRKHGPSTYSCKVYGCDCKVCLPSGRRRAEVGQGMSATVRARRLREAKKGKPVPPTVKHGVYAYRIYGCRCGICVAADSLKKRERRASWRATATGRWADDGHTTILHWPPVGIGIWTCPDCGVQLRHRQNVTTLKEAA